jgi:hypothetical protein
MTGPTRDVWLEGIVQRNDRDLKRYLSQRVGNHAEVEDLSQEIYLRLLRIERKDLIRSPEALLFRLASNAVYEWRLLARNRLLATLACTTLSPDVLRKATLYSSAEPCAMCAGAVYWAGIGRLVYGLSEHRLRTVTGNHPENPTLDLPCREVFKSGQRATEVIGPMLENEAEALHEGVWNK